MWAIPTPPSHPPPPSLLLRKKIIASLLRHTRARKFTHKKNVFSLISFSNFFRSLFVEKKTMTHVRSFTLYYFLLSSLSLSLLFCGRTYVDARISNNSKIPSIIFMKRWRKRKGKKRTAKINSHSFIFNVKHYTFEVVEWGFAMNEGTFCDSTQKSISEEKRVIQRNVHDQVKLCRRRRCRQSKEFASIRLSL